MNNGADAVAFTLNDLAPSPKAADSCMQYGATMTQECVLQISFASVSVPIYNR